MYELIKSIHSYWAYIVLIVLLLTAINALIGLTGKKTYDVKAFRLALFTLVVSHIQLLIGIIVYFVSPRFELWSELGGGVMSNSLARLYLVEHPLTNIIAIVLITVAFSKHKKLVESAAKYKKIFIFYLLALLLLLSRIPWEVWPQV